MNVGLIVTTILKALDVLKFLSTYASYRLDLHLKNLY